MLKGRVLHAAGWVRAVQYSDLQVLLNTDLQEVCSCGSVRYPVHHTHDDRQKVKRKDSSEAAGLCILQLKVQKH